MTGEVFWTVHYRESDRWEPVRDPDPTLALDPELPVHHFGFRYLAKNSAAVLLLVHDFDAVEIRRHPALK